MNPRISRWIGVLSLAIALDVLAAEPPAGADAAAAASPTSSTSSATPTTPPLARTFDLRNANVRDVVRATASSQAGYGYSIDTTKRPRTDADIAAALREGRPAPEKPSTPRLPDRPPPCDGFWSCGLETMLGSYQSDELYSRANRERLMQQGSSTNSHSPNAAIELPRKSAELHEAQAELRPKQP